MLLVMCAIKYELFYTLDGFGLRETVGVYQIINSK